MNAQVKGAILALIALAAVAVVYQMNANKLPVNQSPAEFQLIDRMEKDGVQDFELKRLDGSLLRLSSLKGKVVLLNFWASWCNPCVQEFPSMVKLVNQLKGEVVVVAVSADDEMSDIETFIKAFGIPKENFYVLWDKDKAVKQMYGVEKIPESFLIGRDFHLVRKVLGIEDWATPDAVRYFESLK
jgi:peroxiredoxin